MDKLWRSLVFLATQSSLATDGAALLMKEAAERQENLMIISTTGRFVSCCVGLLCVCLCVLRHGDVAEL